MIIIWLVAMGTVAMGGYWSGIVKQKQWQHKSQRKQKRAAEGTAVSENADDSEDAGDTVDVTPCVGVVFVVIMCLMLLSLYFFYKYLVYVIIGLFALASALGLYACLKVVMLRIPCIGSCSIPKNRLLKKRLEIRRAVLAVLCAGIAIWWLVERNQSYAWILQDILGIVFCINILKTIRLQSLKTCVIILALLFFYDVFFVFITPLFLSVSRTAGLLSLQDGRSIMVDVATGSGSSSTEMLPMVLRIPRLSTSSLSQCLMPYSMLGFGDIVVPGMLVAYCHSFDLKVASGRVYFITTVCAYGVGLLLAFLALSLMAVAQPALLYLVPCTLVPTCLIGWRRKEFRHLWTGDKVTEDVTTTDSVTSTQVNSDIVTQVNDDTQASGDSNVSPVQDLSDVMLSDDRANSVKRQLLTRT
ncbi:Signal peptide peptidase-like 2B [Lamellibrachia satsuma]|nr:Signal peptide peptidase-like 2B [Lamellibrachia satsuma]